MSGAGVNFSSRVSGLGLAAELIAGIQAYPAPLSQTFTAVDFDMQVISILFYSFLYHLQCTVRVVLFFSSVCLYLSVCESNFTR